MPLAGFEEADLLQRERENRIAKMQAASAELAREAEQRMLTKKKGREGRGGSSGNDEGMDRISDRMKVEASAFFSYKEGSGQFDGQEGGIKC